MSSRPSRGAARLAAILDALPDALLLVNCNGTVVNANTIALEAFETPGTALVGRGLLDLLPDFDSKRIPGSMRRPDEAAAEFQERQRPTRMVARRTDGSEFFVEVTSANLEDGRTPYASAFEAAFADHGPGQRQLLHRRRAADARRTRSHRHPRHGSRTRPPAAPDRDDPARGVRGRRRRGHRGPGRPRQPGRRPDPGVPRGRTGRRGAAPPGAALAARRQSAAVRGDDPLATP